MNEHLSPEQLEHLSASRLKGRELLAVLNHLGECEGCRLKTKSPTRAEIIESLFRDEDISGNQTLLPEERRPERNVRKKDWLARLKKIFFG